MSSQFEELESLLIDWETGSLDEDGVERVREILRYDEEARSHFVQLQMLDAAMQLESDAGLPMPPPAVASGSRSRGTSAETETKSQSLTTSATTKFSVNAASTSFGVACALSLLVCVLAGWLVYLQFNGGSRRADGFAGAGNPSNRDESKEATSSGIALVTRLVDVDWHSEQVPLEVGEALSPGRFAIKSGYAQIEFFCGATVIVEGPAELDLQSAMLARVHSGRLRAQVPPAARGFSLEVDDMKVVDLGTEFALSVSSDGANVHVFDGEVELHRPAEKTRLLTAGQAVVRTADGEYQDTDSTPNSFVDIAALESRANDQQAARQKRWEAWSKKLRRDPRLIVYYAFDQTGGWQRKLESSLSADDVGLDGAIVGARRVQGRWASKSGLEFKRPGDRVRVHIPGEYSSLTFACWAKIDSLDRWFNSLFLTDNYNLGEPHWQILDTGQMYFSVRPARRGEKGPRDHKVLSPSFWEPTMSGKWLHLATTYDVDAGRATHCLNGQILHSEAIPDARLVKTTRIGTASIGNWSLPTRPDATFAIRNLNGTIDEFAIFAAALSADEIKEMYESGKP